MIVRSDLLSPSRQDRNAGNSGDLIKHISYLALLRELRYVRPTLGPNHIVEAHGGKGVYISTNRHLVAARQLDGYSRSTLGKAQAACFAPEPSGLGSVSGLQPREIAYAGSSVLHASAVVAQLASGLTVLDSDPGVRRIVERIFSEPCFAGARSQLQIQDPGGPSEPVVLSQLLGGTFASRHVLHFDPFAFVMAQTDAPTRALYRDVIRECDSRVGRRELAAVSVFFTWGSNGAAAKDDLGGMGYLGGQPNGYQELVSTVNPERRLIVSWCCELFFSLLLIVPNDLKALLGHAIEADASWARPRVRRFEVLT